MAGLDQTQQTSRFIREDTRGGDPRTTSHRRSVLPASAPSHAVTANEGVPTAFSSTVAGVMGWPESFPISPLPSIER